VEGVRLACTPSHIFPCHTTSTMSTASPAATAVVAATVAPSGSVQQTNPMHVTGSTTPKATMFEAMNARFSNDGKVSHEKGR
jgi:hypothetical protein